jgi:hypothetical protein
MPKPKPYTLFAADPGERTGVVVVAVAADFNPQAATPDGFAIVDQDVWPVRAVGTNLASWMRPCDVVAYETWRLYKTHALAMIGNDMQPSQVVGMIRYEAWRQNKKLVSNGALVKNPALKTMPGWLKTHMEKSSEQHDQDAIMHAWYVATNRFYGGKESD